MRSITLISVIAVFGLVTGCAGGKESPIGFSLPEGNPDNGEAAFVALQCNACHSTKDVAQLATEGDISVYSGGEVGRVKTYADLVTSIINPSHRLARGYSPGTVAAGADSKMTNYNSIMTVEQMVDLVAYLQPQYRLMVYKQTTYIPYQYR